MNLLSGYRMVSESLCITSLFLLVVQSNPQDATAEADPVRTALAKKAFAFGQERS